MRTVNCSHTFNKSNHMILNKKLPCKNMSDKDFIFTIFQDNGFVTNANLFLQKGSNQENSKLETDKNEQLKIGDIDL